MRWCLADRPQGAAAGRWESLVKRGVHTLKQGEFQILYVAPGVMSSAARERSKDLSVGAITLR